MVSRKGSIGGGGAVGSGLGSKESIKGAKGMDWKEQWYTLAKVGL